jgi:hypothetical protein
VIMPRTPTHPNRPVLFPRKSLPGGKALLRQLQWTASRGLTVSAQDAVRSSVRRDLWASFEKQVPGLTAELPTVPWKASIEERRAYALALRDAQAAVAKVDDSLPKWRSLGPSTIQNGQTYGKWPNGDQVTVNVSGRVSAIAVDPSDSSHLLCGAAKGGIWEQRTNQSWTPRTDSASTLQIGALCFDPRNPAIAYCGTGEGNDDATSVSQGILVSKDGGTTWDILCTDPFVGESFFDLTVDPGDGNRLFAATTAGLRISTNGGLKWSDPRKGSCSLQAAWSVAIHPAGGPNAEILVACADGLWRSFNGSTWENIPLSESPSTAAGVCFVRLAVAIASSNPAVAYAWGAWDSGTTDNPMRTARLWRRDENGTWTVVPGVTAADPSKLGQADYDWCLAVCPNSENEVYCGGVELFRGNLSKGAWTWTNISSQGPGSSIHPDQHALAFSNETNPTLHAGCDGGLFSSNDHGNTWQELNEGLVITQFEYLAVSPNNADWLIGGTQDNGTNLWTNSGVWEQVAAGDGGRCGIRQDQPTQAFHTFYGLDLWRSDSAGYAPWVQMFSIPFDDSTSLFYPPFACSSSNGDIMALGAANLVYVYRDGGPWVELTIPKKSNASSFVSVIVIPNADEIWAGTADGRLFVAKWQGASWSAPGQSEFQEIKAPGNPGAFISDIFPTASGLWLTYSGGSARVFYSNDQGTNWINMTGNLPNLPVNTIHVDPVDPPRIWVGLDLGVFEGRMKDQQTFWAPFTNGLPNVIVGDLVFHKATRRLRAGTQSRGVWEVQL